jgi:hypothetical protein
MAYGSIMSTSISTCGPWTRHRHETITLWPMDDTEPGHSSGWLNRAKVHLLFRHSSVLPNIAPRGGHSSPATCYFPIRSLPHIRVVHAVIYGHFLGVLPMRRKPGISDKTSTRIPIWGRYLVVGLRPRDGRSY